jgi:hypothetical protein
MATINWLAVIVAAASSFLLGGLWYSAALFGAAWNRENGSASKSAEGRHPARVFGTSFVFALIAAVAFAYLFGPAASFADAALRGFIVGLGFVAASFGINYQFAGRSTQLWLIDGGYHVVQFVIYGVVIGLWR